ncbi:MAG: SDR family oxidoreductase [Candidatus Lokiarchaeota archaeon]|nr:SDR family oxidoreductase [Candidatus Lokiarchaeota archaeon]
MEKFKGKSVFLTGGSTGIGRQTALDFAREGAMVTIFDINESGGTQTAEDCKAVGAEKSLFIKGDISNFESVDGAIQKAFDEMGAVDILVNSAGVLRDAMIHKLEEKNWDFVIAINLKGTFLAIQACAKRWIEKCKEMGNLNTMEYPDRRIINISSMAANGNIGQMNYSASKAGVIGMTLTAAKELVRYNVRTHAVQPTMVATPLTEELLTKQEGKFKEMYEGRIPFGIGKPSYISEVILFLAGPESIFMNGNIIPINGGKLGDL